MFFRSYRADSHDEVRFYVILILSVQDLDKERP